MRESAGKRVTRKLFYTEFLPGCLSSEQLAQGNYLLLLGQPPKELEFTDAWDVPRHQIWSVERDGDVYHAQESLELGVNLDHVELWEHLRYLLHKNQQFQVMNLDIEGSFLTNIDPALDAALLYCWRNPETVVATYSSIGRDKTLLMEGVKSLATFLWLAPEETIELLATFQERYRLAGYKRTTRLILRDLFWLRSHLEHMASTAAQVNLATTSSVITLFTAENKIWEAVVAAGNLPLKLGQLQRTVEKLAGSRNFRSNTKVAWLPSFAVDFQVIHHVLYRAQRPWSHRGYFTKFTVVDQSNNCFDWTRTALTSLAKSALTTVDEHGQRRDWNQVVRADPKIRKIVVWDPGLARATARTKIYTTFSPRQLTVRTPMDDWLPSIQAIRTQMKQRPTGKEVMSMAAYMKDGSLTNWGRERLRELAREHRNTDVIAAIVPDSIPRQSIIAYVAIANRSGNGHHLTRNGRLTEHGKAAVIKLARQHRNWDTERVLDALAPTVRLRVNKQSITAHIARARR